VEVKKTKSARFFIIIGKLHKHQVGLEAKTSSSTLVPFEIEFIGRK